MFDEIYNIKEVATILGVTPDTVRKYIANGKLKGYCHRGAKNRKEIKVIESDLKTFTYLHFLEPYWPGRKRPPNLPKIQLKADGLSGKKVNSNG